MRSEHVESRFRNQANSKTFKNIISTFELDKKSVFDIGCSYGEHLVNFGKGSFGITLKDIEMEYGKSVGLDIICGDIEDENVVIEKKFDAVFANNVLEHLYSPHKFLCNIKKYLNDDGLLILGVPCVTTIRPLMKLKKFSGCLSPHHLNFYNKYTLTKTVERSGWSIIDVRGFRIDNQFLDSFLNPIYPHFYVIAKIDKNFKGVSVI